MVRELTKKHNQDLEYFDFFYDGMEFEEFIILFGQWYSKDIIEFMI